MSIATKYLKNELLQLRDDLNNLHEYITGKA
jgi:hypothetical protein